LRTQSTTPASSRSSSDPAAGSSSAFRAAATKTWKALTRRPRAGRMRRPRAGWMMKADTRSRLESALKSKSGDLKLVAYMMAGHPSAKRSIDVGKRLAASGIAALEIGIPHSDPLADGPMIQRAGQSALAHGMTVAGAIEVAEAVAREGVP